MGALEDQLGIDFSEEKEAIEEYIKSESDYANLTEATKVLFRAVKWRLSQNDCKNRGYILVNYPYGVEDAKHIFNKCIFFNFGLNFLYSQNLTLQKLKIDRQTKTQEKEGQSCPSASR